MWVQVRGAERSRTPLAGARTRLRGAGRRGLPGLGGAAHLMLFLCYVLCTQFLRYSPASAHISYLHSITVYTSRTRVLY